MYVASSVYTRDGPSPRPSRPLPRNVMCPRFRVVAHRVLCTMIPGIRYVCHCLPGGPTACAHKFDRFRYFLARNGGHRSGPAAAARRSRRENRTQREAARPGAGPAARARGVRRHRPARAIIRCSTTASQPVTIHGIPRSTVHTFARSTPVNVARWRAALRSRPTRAACCRVPSRSADP